MPGTPGWSSPEYAIIAICGLALGLVWLGISPGHEDRASGMFGQLIYDFQNPGDLIARILRTAMQNIIYFVFVLLLILRRKKMGTFICWKRRYLQFAVVSGLASVALMFVTMTDARVSIWADFSSILGIMVVANSGWNDACVGVRRKAFRGALILCTLFLLVHWAFVDYYALQMRRNFLDGLNRYFKSESGMVFVHVTDIENLPLICGNMPELGMYTFGSHFFYNYYLRDSARKPLAFVPEELGDVTWQKAETVPGNKGMRKYRGRYIQRYDESETSDWILLTSGGRCRPVKCWQTPFVSEGDGRQYIYYYIFENRLDRIRGPIERIDN